jgi:hypothetical protein
MALQASGPISFSEIANEFGTPLGKNLGAYRVSQSVAALSNFPLDAGIPQSGTIRFSDFYNKRLNIVVNCGSGSRITARSRYNDNSGITVIGGFRGRPSSSSGRKVWIHTNETIGSDIAASSSPNRQYSSLITGGWESNTDLRLDIGPNGVVTGAGGNGGAGGNIGYLSCGSGQVGRFGTSAIGVDYQPIIITNRGRIQGGGGGGGGGGSAFAHNHRSRGRSVWSLAAGGGGGGGLGSPGGSGGSAGSGTGGNRSGTVRNAAAGGSGSLFSGGGGGVGAYQSGSGATAEGGSGGSAGNGGASGRVITAFNDRCSSPGGGAGASGFGIIITNNGTGVTITNSGTLIGGIVYNTSVS